jgi:hypothetical protein
MAPYEDLLFILGVLASGVLVTWLVLRFASERARERERRGRFVEAQIERLAEAREFVEFARSEAGLTWLRADAGESRVRRGLLVLALVGILALALGGALFVNAARLAPGVDSDAAARASAAWWGTVLVALGIGSLVAAAVLARIARSWGLIPPARRRDAAEGE